ncbi:hypothetical protein SAMN04487996_122102 [Dyadobacter soli]|uniref:DUF4377 domain-containing protein n=1 Tax=Dyadobacter soli TaxID=659014 RepID=A0A1G7WMI3_9BACT|nr:hypothetical protein [Dyadobacter soli]SDG73068.1 hypothetical protein SAMN04487996_122102 [Dyadobacter soli]
MKHYSLLRLMALSAVLITSLAFSCQDHHIPDPVTNCDRVNGTLRAVDCEFEFVKAEFSELRNSNGDTLRYGTVTPGGDPTIVLPEVDRGRWIRSYISMFYFLSMEVQVTIRRIAPAPANTTDYVLRQDFTANSNNDEFPTTAIWYLEPDEDLKPVKINIPVGGTYTYHTVYNFVGTAGFSGDDIDYRMTGDYYLLVQNVETSKLLKQAPYNYDLYRDRAEAKLMFRTKIIPGICVFCKQGS